MRRAERTSRSRHNKRRAQGSKDFTRAGHKGLGRRTQRTRPTGQFGARKGLTLARRTASAFARTTDSAFARRTGRTRPRRGGRPAFARRARGPGPPGRPSRESESRRLTAALRSGWTWTNKTASASKQNRAPARTSKTNRQPVQINKPPALPNKANRQLVQKKASRARTSTAGRESLGPRASAPARPRARAERSPGLLAAPPRNGAMGVASFRVLPVSESVRCLYVPLSCAAPRTRTKQRPGRLSRPRRPAGHRHSRAPPPPPPSSPASRLRAARRSGPRAAK